MARKSCGMLLAILMGLALSAGPLSGNAQKIYPETVPTPPVITPPAINQDADAVAPAAPVEPEPVFVIRPPVRKMPSMPTVTGTTVPMPTPASNATSGAASAPADQKIGQVIRVQAIDLPPATPMNQPSRLPPDRALRIPREGIRLPDGFVARPWARGLQGPRGVLPLPNGDVAISESAAGRVVLARDSDGDGVADRIGRLADRLNFPTGLAVQDDGIYVADLDRVWRLPLFNGQPRPGVPPQPVTPPGALGVNNGGGGVLGEHDRMRPLLFAPDGKKFYVGISAMAALADVAMPQASVQEFSRDGQVRRSMAYGLFSPQALAYGPDQALLALVQERDGMGPSLVPDFLTSLSDGGFYGWPYAWLGPNPQPEWGTKRPDLVAKTLVPDQLFLAHSNPAGLLWYQGDQFPARYRDGLFVSLAGSWDRRNPVGYSIAFVPFKAGKPDGSYEIFASGFRIPADDPQSGGSESVWGRPAGLAMLEDGSLLVADMLGGTIWRIAAE